MLYRKNKKEIVLNYRNNHFIPTFYLKQWNISGKTNFFCSNLRDTSFCDFKERNTGNVECAEDALYWLNTGDKNYKLFLEKDVFRRQEAEWSQIVNKSVNKLTNEDKAKLVNFVINIRLRNPDIVYKLKSNAEIKNTENNVKANFLRRGWTLQDYYMTVVENNMEDKIKNLNLETLGDIHTLNAYPEFIKKTFGKGKIVVLDTSKSGYKLITSNYPIIDGKNLITKDGYDIIFPLSKDKILFVVNEKSVGVFDEYINNKCISDFVINTNIGILNNYKNRGLKIDYQIYSTTSNKKEIIPENLINTYFI